MSNKTAWLVDGLAVLLTLKAKKTFGQWTESFIRLIAQSNIAESASMSSVNDFHSKYSVNIWIQV